jgi:hypothetical protein
MIIKSILGAGCALIFTALGASAGTVPFDVTSYNFVLAGGGGAASGTLNGVSVETFCDDFANELDAPSNHDANETTLSTDADLSDTRFGNVSSNGWTAITLNDGNSADAQDDAFFDNPGSGTTALARYEMAAYLVSLYNLSQGANTSNNEIQEAIWTIMDPTAEGPVIDPSGLSPDSYLEQAAGWYMGMNTPGNQAALNSFLSNYEIVSSAKMTYTNGVGIGGFQEQIVDPVATPEPRGGVWFLFSLLLVGFLGMRRSRAAHGTVMASEILLRSA